MINETSFKCGKDEVLTTDVCRGCGHTGFHATHHKELNEVRGKGYQAVAF